MYIYRLDTTKTFYERCVKDPVFRGTISVPPNHPFAHAQAVEAMRAAPDGHVVYTMSFWKTLAAAIDAKRHQDSTGFIVLQRIPADHPVLKEYSCSDDEYRRDAFFYWKACPTSPIKNGTKSATGIHHRDIEVLAPNDKWIAVANIRFRVDKNTGIHYLIFNRWKHAVLKIITKMGFTKMVILAGRPWL